MSHSATATLRRFSKCAAAGDRISCDQLIAWINERLEANVTGFKDLATRKVYCRLLCKLSPGSLPLTKVRRGAKRELDCRHNFSLLQQGLHEARLRREIGIEGLVAGRFRDHCELLKFLKRLLDDTLTDHEANAAGGVCSARAPELGQATAERGHYSREIRRTRRTLPGPPPPAPLA
ncbi:hypothetical protein HPB48_002438 [Haemaphysalis longicornis]|uniref:Calponin-homology (CH) domain-containing protein n=1 Tax=Haemaphysalis longicornis TaxID=44386 RepID=A0A9J6FAW4_HAELO|nr:hypothetical protein HPB48_002438 [Haemaphysalis longicornis]